MPESVHLLPTDLQGSGAPAECPASDSDAAGDRSRPASRAIWVVEDDEGLRELCARDVGKRDRLLLLCDVLPEKLEFLRARFGDVVAPVGRLRMLRRDELIEVLRLEQRRDYLIAALPLPEEAAVVLYRGDLRRLTVPFGFFQATGGGTRPDFDDVSVVEHGQAVRLGKYEASTHAILYAHDRDYRRRARAHALHADDSFGAALRRCRLSKGLKLSDLAVGVSERELRRIEANQVRPHRRTLNKLAKRLGVPVDEIPSF